MTWIPADGGGFLQINDRRVKAMKCWCGGTVGPRNSGDENGLGCLDSVFHDWNDRAPSGPINRLYVSGPMTGYPDCNYPAFHDASKRLRDVGYDISNPAECESEASYRALIKDDIIAVINCDGIAVLEGWWLSTGARLEVHVAGVLQMPVRPVEEWLTLRGSTRAASTPTNR